jgi:hypothetical protein
MLGIGTSIVIAHAAELGGMVLGIGVRRDFIFG